MKRRSPDKGFNDHITSSWQVFSSGETLLQISFEIFVYRGLNSQLTALPTPCFSYPKPSVSFLNPLWRAAGCKDCGPSSDQALGYGVEGRTKWSHTSCALSRGGVHRLMCGWGVLSFPGKDGGDTGGKRSRWSTLSPVSAIAMSFHSLTPTVLVCPGPLGKGGSQELKHTAVDVIC